MDPSARLVQKGESRSKLKRRAQFLGTGVEVRAKNKNRRKPGDHGRSRRYDEVFIGICSRS